MKKLTIKVLKKPALTVTRSATKRERLVYIITTNKPMPYLHGRSRIVYIGTTKNGVDRIANSAAAKARAILTKHGCNQLIVHVVTCKPRNKVRTWIKLETELLLEFQNLFFGVPQFNKKGMLKTGKPIKRYFTVSRLQNILRSYR